MNYSYMCIRLGSGKNFTTIISQEIKGAATGNTRYGRRKLWIRNIVKAKPQRHPVRVRRIFSRPGSVNSSVPNFKLKTVN